MKLKKIASICVSGVLLISSFVGCGTDEKASVSFNPKQGDSYELNVDMDVQSKAGEEESGVNMSFVGDITFSSVSDDEIVSEMRYNDLSMEMDMLGEKLKINKDNPEFSEMYDMMSSLVYKISMDKEGNVTSTSVEGDAGEESLFDLQESAQSFVGSLNVFQGKELVEGEKVEIPFNSSSASIDLSQYGINLEDNLKCEVAEISDDEAVLEAEVKDIDVEGVKVNMEVEYTINLKSGIVSGCKINMSGDGKTDNGDASMDMNVNVQIKEK